MHKRKNHASEKPKRKPESYIPSGVTTVMTVPRRRGRTLPKLVRAGRREGATANGGSEEGRLTQKHQKMVRKQKIK